MAACNLEGWKMILLATGGHLYLLAARPRIYSFNPAKLLVLLKPPWCRQDQSSRLVSKINAKVTTTSRPGATPPIQSPRLEQRLAASFVSAPPAPRHRCRAAFPLLGEAHPNHQWQAPAFVPGLAMKQLTRPEEIISQAVPILAGSHGLFRHIPCCTVFRRSS